MKTAVILYLCISISLVLVVRCEYESDGENKGENDGLVEEGGDGLGLGGIYTGTDEKMFRNYKCLVCRATLEEMKTEIEKVDPRKRIDLTATKSIQYSKSETYLTDLMETICENDDNFSRIRLVVIQKTVIKEMHRTGGMFDYTPEKLHERLKHYCLEVVEENDEVLLKHFMAGVTPSNIVDIICTETAEYCGEDDDDDEFEDNYRDEL